MNTQAKVDKRATEYVIWQGMIARCYTPSNTSFPLYGARGVRVCERWIRSYTDFLEDMGKRPKGCSIERIDNDGPYSPTNCRWATRKEQARNTRTNRFITLNGERLTHAEWSLRLGGCPSLVHSRIRRGWSELDAVRRMKRRYPGGRCPRHQKVNQ